MKPEIRQRRIVEVLLEQGRVSVAQLVDLLQVSEVTIRNDLRALEQQQKLVRTHGGATLGRARTGGRATAAPGERNGDASSLRLIAQRAAALVEDGDAILVDSGAATAALVDLLLPRQSLTVLTNSLHFATTLASNPTNTVLLVGGQLQPNLDTLDAQLTADAFSQLRIQKAFLTCDGVSRAQGFACNDLVGAKTRSQFLTCAGEVIVLAPGENVGRPALMSFAALDQVHHLITSLDAPSTVVDELRLSGVHVSVCGQHLTQIGVDRSSHPKYRIAFANLNEQQPFAVTVRQSLERAAQEHGNIELIVANNAADPQTSLTVARSLIDSKVDLVIEFQQDEHTNHILMDMFRSAGIPVIAMEIPVPGATFFGVENYRAGRLAGEAAISWIREHWGGHVDKLVCLEQPESGPTPQMRIEAQVDALRQARLIGDADVIRCATRGDLDGSRHAATEALRNIPWGKRVLFIGINANSTRGAMEAAEALDRQAQTASISQNASVTIRQELARGNPMLIGAVDYYPQNYGPRVIQVALDLLEGRPVPPAVYVEHVLLTARNIRQLYPHDTADDRDPPRPQALAS